jgi:hypothetical protein
VVALPAPGARLVAVSGLGARVVPLSGLGARVVALPGLGTRLPAVVTVPRAASAGPAVRVHRLVQARRSRQYQRTSVQALPPSGTIWAVGRAMPHSQQRSTWSCRWWAGSGCLGPAISIHLRAACRGPGQSQVRATAAARLARQPLVLSVARHRPAGHPLPTARVHTPAAETFSDLAGGVIESPEECLAFGGVAGACGAP